MLQIDYKSGVSICDQIINGFINLISIGVLKTDDPMPSVRSMALSISVNPNTIQKAYAILEERQIIYTVKGKGSFVADAENTKRELLLKEREALKSAVNSAKLKGLTLKEVEDIIKCIYEKGGNHCD